MKDIRLQSLKVVLLASLLEDAIEDVRDTSLFKQGVKNQANRMVNVMKPYTDQIDDIYNKNPEFTTNIMRNLEEFVKKLSDLNMVDIVMMNQIYDHYINDKENWQNLMSIEFNELEK